jgi:hypothetical protein
MYASSLLKECEDSPAVLYMCNKLIQVVLRQYCHMKRNVDGQKLATLKTLYKACWVLKLGRRVEMGTIVMFVQDLRADLS